MRASKVQIFLSSSVAALILIRATSLAPDLEATLPVLAPAPPPSEKMEIRPPLQVTYAAFPRAAARRTSTIEHCFTSSFELNVPASPGQIALIGAALKEDWKAVLRMLEAGGLIDTTDDSGVTPLMAAAMQGNLDVIRLLLERGARVDFTDLSGLCALHYAISAGKLEAVRLLLPLVSNLETVSTAGNDVLKMALETGDMKIFQAVLERLPATLEWTANTRDALETALRGELKEQVRLLLSKHPAPPTREGGTAPLIAYAIANDDASLFHTLLACGSDPNIVIPKVCEKDFTALLKNKYLRLYIENETGVNLLMLAAGLGRTDYVRALLDAGADRSRSTPRYKMIPLYFAAWTENWQCVQMLLGGGPMPDELRVEISLARQNMSVIKDGVTVFTTKCSTGRQGFTTKPGHYVITDKDRDHRSTIYKCPMPYFMRLSCRDFGMHEGVVPTYPASHGCIRLPGDAARKLFSEIPVGTVVMIN
jgi:ankyrin repeat protein